MGKLGDLWQRLNGETDEQKIKDIQKEINRIESWCIENNFAGIKELTDWTTYKKKTSKKSYRFESIRDGGFNIPVGAFTGVDRCNACKYNKHLWCDKGRTKPCLANV